MTVRSLAVEGPVVTLRYATMAADYERLAADIGRVSGGFYREIEPG